MSSYYWLIIGVVIFIYTIIGLARFAGEYTALTAMLNPNGGDKKLPPDVVKQLQWKSLFWII